MAGPSFLPERPAVLFRGFFRLLPRYGIDVNIRQILEIYRGLKKGLVSNLEDLFILLRLVLTRRVEQNDPFERAFLYYFKGIDIPAVREGDWELLETRQFREWLREAMERGQLPANPWQLGYEELMKKFWETVREQLEAHHGGNKWVGTGGSSPFGHSGLAQPGVRVFGEGGNRSAFRVIGDRRYLSYSQTSNLSDENMQQALNSLKRLKPRGPASELNLGETIYRTARAGGEIELVFEREMRDRISVALLLDNGGRSMIPHIRLTRRLFSRLRGRFQRLETYYFHNTIYGEVYKDEQRRDPLPLKEFLKKDPETRVIIVGDASMAPEELMLSGGQISWFAGHQPGTEGDQPSLDQLAKIRERFSASIWLNPVNRELWTTTHGAWTIRQIGQIIPMEDLTLGGIRRAVEWLNRDTV